MTLLQQCSFPKCYLIATFDVIHQFYLELSSPLSAYIKKCCILLSISVNNPFGWVTLDEVIRTQDVFNRPNYS